MDNINMKTIKHLKEDYLQLGNLIYKPYKICSLPAHFGCIEINEKEGISQSFKYKGYTYISDKIAKQNMKEILIAEQMAINITNWPLLIIILIIGIIIGNKIKQYE